MMGEISRGPIGDVIWMELACWRDEALARGDRELAGRLQHVIRRLKQRKRSAKRAR